MREVKKMLGSHNKEVTALQKKINTLVSQREKNSQLACECEVLLAWLLSMLNWTTCHLPWLSSLRKLSLIRRELTDTASSKPARWDNGCECISAVTYVAASLFIVSLQMEDIKLPMKRGRMEDIGDEEVHVMQLKSWRNVAVKHFYAWHLVLVCTYAGQKATYSSLHVAKQHLLCI